MKILLLSAAVLLGCDARERHLDVSAEAESQAVIGTRYEIVGNVDAYGVRRNSKAPVDYVTLIPPPGTEGPEVGFRIRLRPGSTVTIRKVTRSNRLFDRMTFMIDLEGTHLPIAAPARIDLTGGNETRRYLQLNPAIYRKIPAPSTTTSRS